MRLKKLCPECDGTFYGKRCDCGYTTDKLAVSKQTLSVADRQERRLAHVLCHHETMGKRCQMMGTFGVNPGEMGEDKWGTKMRGPYYCSFHRAAINRRHRTRKDCAHAFKEFYEKNQASGYRDQFSKFPIREAWYLVSGERPIPNK